MNELESLLAAAVSAPADDTARGVLADYLEEHGEAGIAPVVRDAESGPRVLRAVYAEADRLKVRPNLHLLWYCAMNDAPEVAEETGETGVGDSGAEDAWHELEEAARRRDRERRRRFLDDQPRPIWTTNVKPPPGAPPEIWSEGTGDETR